jgi:hypothetical protein
MKTLHLTLKRRWFDLIASGQKREEYREVKPYWTVRLVGREFDVIRFRNGYAKDAATMDVELLRISYGLGKPEWGGGSEPVYILHLGAVLADRASLPQTLLF